MKKFLYSWLVILAACSPNNKTETAAASSASAEAPLQTEEGSTVKMTGTVHFSFEQAEFVAQGKHYFILKGQGLIGQVQEKRQSDTSYNVTLDNVCIRGKVLGKEQNKGNGFGPLERYEQAVEVEGLC